MKSERGTGEGKGNVCRGDDVGGGGGTDGRVAGVCGREAQSVTSFIGHRQLGILRINLS